VRHVTLPAGLSPGSVAELRHLSDLSTPQSDDGMSRGMTSCKTTLELTLTGEGLESLLATPAASLSIPAVKTPAVDTSPVRGCGSNGRG
jgi:hypothetical protein